MSLFLGFIQFFLICIICAYEYQIRSSSVFLWATLLIMFGVTHYLSLVSNNYSYPQWVMNHASSFVILFCTVYLATKLTLHGIKKAIHINVSPKETEKVIGDIVQFRDRPYINKYVIACCFFLIYVILYKVYMGIKIEGNILSTSWATFYKAQNNYSIEGLFPTFYLFGSSILLIFLARKKRKNYFFLCLIICSYVLVTRNRVNVLPILISFICYMIYNKEKLTIKKVVLFVGIGIFVVYIVYGLLVIRHYGNIITFIQGFSFGTFNQKILNKITSSEGELGLRNAFYYFIENNNNFEGFGRGNTYLRMLLVFLPTRFSLGIKPESFGYVMGKAWLPGVDGFSMAATLFGDAYGNFGYIGAVMGVFWAIFSIILDKIIDGNKSDNVKYSLIMVSSYCYVIIGRGFVSEPFFTLCVTIIFIKIINKLITTNFKGLFRKPKY